MKSIFAVFLFVFSWIQTSAQTDDYYILEGKIDKYPITLEIYKSNFPEEQTKSYVGNYYYHSQEIPITIYQDNTKNSGEFILNTWDDDDKKETFSGTFSNGTYKGTWTKGKQKLAFELETFTDTRSIGIIHREADRKVQLKTGENETAATSTYHFYLPKDTKLQKEFMQKVDKDYTDFESWTKMRFADFESGYRKDVQEMMKNSPEIPSFAMNYEFIETVYPYLNSENYLVMSHSVYEYTGGAHGMSAEAYFTYDKRNKKWLEIGDVLNLDKFEQINKVLDKAVRKEFNLPEGYKLNEVMDSPFIAESIAYSENFTLSKKGITFHYGLYELTPYVYGYFSQFVSYEDLKPFLKKGFKY